MHNADTMKMAACDHSDGVCKARYGSGCVGVEGFGGVGGCLILQIRLWLRYLKSGV